MTTIQRSKYIIFAALILPFIGCLQSEPETPPPDASTPQMSLKASMEAQRPQQLYPESIDASLAEYVAAHAESPRLPDMALFVADALATSALGCYGSATNYTPTLDGLASEGVRYTKASSASTWTRPAFCSMMTSLYPSQHKSEMLGSRLSDEFQTLAEALKQKGYFTIGFVRSPADAILGPATGIAQGFDAYFNAGGEKEVFDALAQFLDRNAEILERMEGGGVFIFWHLFEPHAPYANNFPSFIRGNDMAGDAEHGFLFDCYNSDVLLVDQRIGQIFLRLKWHGLFDKLNVVFSADHGESFGEKPNVWDHCNPYETCTNVPLIIRFPQKTSPGKVDSQNLVSHLDIMPTLLALADAPVPPSCQGRNLLDPSVAPRTYTVSEDRQYSGTISIRDKSHKLIVTNAAKSDSGAYYRQGDWDAETMKWRLFDPDYPLEYELYVIENDPQELNNIASEQPDILNRFKEALMTHCDSIMKPNLDKTSDTIPFSEESVEELKSLGYLGE